MESSSPCRFIDTQPPTQELEADVLRNIAEITHYMQKREYLRANDAYLRLSIGNAPWPIGVTMVGVRCDPALFMSTMRACAVTEPGEEGVVALVALVARRLVLGSFY